MDGGRGRPCISFGFGGWVRTVLSHSLTALGTYLYGLFPCQRLNGFSFFVSPLTINSALKVYRVISVILVIVQENDRIREA